MKLKNPRNPTNDCTLKSEKRYKLKYLWENKEW